MKYKQEFTVDEAIQPVWDFFQRADEVAKCMPGIDDIQVVDPDQLSVRMTQKVGPISASFDTSVRITERIPPKVIQFTLIGKAVRGAVGNFRATNTVTLNEAAGSTHVAVEGDAALAGALGSVGQRIIAKQAEKLTAQFAANLSSVLAGGSPAASDGSETSIASLAPDKQRAGAAAPARAAAAAAASQPLVARQRADDPWNKVAASFSVATFIVSLFVLYHVIAQG